MKWFIIIGVMLSLVGSAMWVMPTKRQKFQAKLRLHARTLGFNVQLARLEAPRAAGEMEGETISVPAYRLLRTNMERKDSDGLVVWQVFRLQSMATTGLVEGWSWMHGENELTQTQLNVLNDVLSSLPKDVTALESNPVQVTAYWHERGDEAVLAEIKERLDRILDAKF